MMLKLFIYTLIYADKSAIITELSKQWSSFTEDEKEVWKVKASETSAWTEVPKKKLMRDLTSAIDENVRGEDIISVQLNDSDSSL